MRPWSLEFIAFACVGWGLSGYAQEPFPRGSLPEVPNALNFETPSNLQNPISVDAAKPGEEGLVRIALPQNGLPDEPLQVRSASQTVSIMARDVDLRIVLGHLADECQINIVVAESVDARVTTTLADVPVWQALDAILKINGLTWIQQGNIIFVTRPSASESSGFSTPGLRLQVFDLNYTASSEVLEVVKGLCSVGGKAFAHTADIANTRQTRERIVVEDYPERLEAIAQYLAGVDNAPRQVLIEAHVLQVTLTDDERHGINLSAVARLAGARIEMRSQGFANGDSNPGFMLGVDGHDLDSILECLCSNSNVRTLAAPKVLVVNGQEARIQIGSKFGYFVTTATQATTLQSVNFLDIGVLLQVQPTITEDNQVLLSVSPKVSGGRINPNTGLPEEETTEASTTVLLPDGRGMIIGGLIKESDSQQHTSVPWLGRQPIIGRLFRRSSRESERIEVILALTPHIVPYTEMIDLREKAGYYSATDTQGVVTAGQTK